jgi:glycosyltransferase involved in cell wall biosynthesis
MKTYTVLFLSSVFSHYFDACLAKFSRLFNADIHVVHWPSTIEFPYLPETAGIIYRKKPEQVKELLDYAFQIEPDCIYVPGWMDKDYLKVAKQFRRTGIPIICGIDSQWKGSVKDHLKSLLRQKVSQRFFSHAWVAGTPQYEMARRLGFSPSTILEGLYTADSDLFQCDSQANSEDEIRRLLFVGRLVEIKQPVQLANAFISAQKNSAKPWKLTICGTGPLASEIPKSPKIETPGFINPFELAAVIKKHDACVLPSIEEPWGVAIHEYAACGKPIIASKNCGAVSRLLVDQFNGYVVDYSQHSALENSLIRLFETNTDTLTQMGQRSQILSQFNSTALWAYRLRSILS